MESIFNPAEITLRPFKLSDVDDFLKWGGNDKVTRYLRCNTFTSRNEAIEFLGKVISTHPWYRAICFEDRPIGAIYINVTQDDEKDQRRGEIGYMLSERYWGKGIATKAVKMVSSCVFRELKYLDRVEGLVFAENLASQRVLEKAGYLKEGILRKYFFVKGQSRDVVVYSIVNSEPYC